MGAPSPKNRKTEAEKQLVAGQFGVAPPTSPRLPTEGKAARSGRRARKGITELSVCLGPQARAAGIIMAQLALFGRVELPHLVIHAKKGANGFFVHIYQEDSSPRGALDAPR